VKPTKIATIDSQPAAPNFAPYATTSRPLAYPPPMSTDWRMIDGRMIDPNRPIYSRSNIAPVA